MLLARLATARQCTVGRAEAAAFLWPDAPPDKARASLRQSVARLRHTVGSEAVLSDAQSLMLAPSRWWVDILDLEAALADTHSVGEFVAGEYFKEPQIDLWLDEERRHWRERCLALMHAERERHRDDPGRLISCCHAILTLDAYDEATHRDLMRALAALGHVGRAIKQYETLQTLQRDGLGLTPEPETRALFQQLRQRRAPAEALPEVRRTAPDDSVAMRFVTVISVHPGSASTQALRAFDGVAQQVGDTRQEGEPVRFVVGLSDAAESAAATALARVWPRRADAKIGAACGFVVVRDGAGADPQGAVLGEADMLALLAEPSELLVSDALWRQLGNAAQGERVDIRGRMAWSLSDLSAASQRAAPPFVGRQAECTQVTAFLSRLQNGGGGTLVVRGPAGIGKTRLLDEALQSFKTGDHACAMAAFGAFGDDAVAFRQRLALALANAFDTPPQPQDMLLHLRRPMRALLGADVALGAGQDVAQDHALSRDVLLELMRRLTAGRPLVVRMEDTHWARPSQIEYLAALLSAAADLPVAFLITERPTESGLAAAVSGWSSGAPALVLTLNPLGPADSRSLFRHGTNDRDATEDLIEKANGNPLFLHFLAQLPAAGAQAQDGDLPTSLISLVQEQLDHQPMEVTVACHRAAILGHRFPTTAFTSVFPEIALKDLVRSGFLVVGDTHTEFTHALIQEAIYAMVPQERRPELHSAAAEVFSGDNPVLWAEHALRADDDAAAARASLAAAELLVFQRSLTAVHRFVEAGLPRATDNGTRARLLFCRANVNREFGESDVALKDYGAAIALAEDADLKVQIALKMWAVRKYLGAFDQARDDLATAASLAEGAKLSSATRSELAQEMGDAAFQEGDGAKCLAHNQTAFAIAEEAGLVVQQVRALGGIGDAHYARLNLDAALTSFTECVALATAHELHGLANAHLPMVAISRLYVEAGTPPLEDAAMAAEQSRMGHNLRSEILALCAMSEIQAFAADREGLETSTERMAALIGDGSNRFRRDFDLCCAFRDWLRGDPANSLQRAEAYIAEHQDPYLAPEMAGLAAVLTPDRKRALAAIEMGRRILKTGAVAHSFLAFHHFAMRSAVRWGWPDLARALADTLAETIDLSCHRFAALAHAQTLAALDGDEADRQRVMQEILAANLALFVKE
ncbi:MAG: AAA family ATPase [Pseudomonadota bacterium]